MRSEQVEQVTDRPARVEKGSDEAQETAVRDQFARWQAALAFGRSFFLGHLGAYVRDRCPDPDEALPFVHLHLVNGEMLDVCHVIGLTPRWVALAVYEGTSRAMRTELVPYETILRITISPGHALENHMGFRQEAPPAVQETAEETLSKTAAVQERSARRRRKVDAPQSAARRLAGKETRLEPGAR